MALQHLPPPSPLRENVMFFAHELWRRYHIAKVKEPGSWGSVLAVFWKFTLNKAETDQFIDLYKCNCGLSWCGAWKFCSDRCMQKMSWLLISRVERKSKWWVRAAFFVFCFLSDFASLPDPAIWTFQHSCLTAPSDLALPDKVEQQDQISEILSDLALS